MSILVVGSVALDTVETPFGRAEEALGGSATYFSLAARLYTPVRLIAVVGDDFPQQHVDLLQNHGVEAGGLERAAGRTFRWSGRYDFDLNTATTLDTQLNVFATFHPKLSPVHRASEFVFVANINPDLQREVLQQVPSAKLRVLDTMNYWIGSKPEQLAMAIAMVDVVLMNEAEVRQFAGTPSLTRAARRVLELGPRALIVKKGEYGAVLFSEWGYFVAPAYPLEDVRDPTGAGDSFAGGFLGYIARNGEITPSVLKQAIIHGSVVASFTVEDFSVERLRRVTWDDVCRRYEEFRVFTAFDTEA